MLIVVVNWKVGEKSLFIDSEHESAITGETGTRQQVNRHWSVFWMTTICSYLK